MLAQEIHQELASIQVLARLSLGFAIFIMGWIGGELADVFKDDREVVFMIALFIPLLSILGVSLVRLNPVPISKLNKHVLFGGLAFALFVVIMGYAQVPYAQEIVFVISLSIVLILLNNPTHYKNRKT
jgi:hypothetical protein